MNKSYITIAGFIMFLIGMISIILSLVGLNLKILSIIETWGGGIAFLIKVLLSVLGLIIVYLANTFDQAEE
ncbi:MAG TPA: hypothetical protein PKC30_13700 [Saprospiraceae bacterium]|nr:hypothetical protein [Saprospiraceae bacterium]